MFSCMQQDGGPWRLHDVPPFSAAGPLTKLMRPHGGGKRSGEESHIPVSLRQFDGFHSHLKNVFFCRQKLEEWENPRFKFPNKCRMLSALQCESHLGKNVADRCRWSTSLHLYCSLSSFLPHPCRSIPSYSKFTQYAYFSVCGIFASVVCVMAVLLSSYDLDPSYITLNDGV